MARRPTKQGAPRAHDYPGWQQRNIVSPAFREVVCEANDFVPFLHQAQSWLAFEGKLVLDREPELGEVSMPIQQPDKSVALRAVVPRPAGPANVVADLTAFKGGKTVGASMLISGLMGCAGSSGVIVGWEHKNCRFEFDAVCTFLLSEKGMNLPADWNDNWKNQNMYIRLRHNGAFVYCHSWKAAATLKGDEVDYYVYSEAFLLPGPEVYFRYRQNLARRHGIAFFPTTADSPWIGELHKLGHGGDEDFLDWHCICGVPRSVNPYAFDAKALAQDTKALSEEEVAVYHFGMVGQYINSTYKHQVGTKTFTPSTHPHLWKHPKAKAEADDNPIVRDRGGSYVACLENLKIPDNFIRLCGIDGGTWFAGVGVVFDPTTGDGFVVFEEQNYVYKMAKERGKSGYSLTTFAKNLKKKLATLGGRWSTYTDANSQWKRELRVGHGITITAKGIDPQLRCEKTTELVQAGKLYWAPWITTAEKEMEMAVMPADSTATGKYERKPIKDHGLDCVEHAIARRVIAVEPEEDDDTAGLTAFEKITGYRFNTRRHGIDPHLGRRGWKTG